MVEWKRRASSNKFGFNKAAPKGEPAAAVVEEEEEEEEGPAVSAPEAKTAANGMAAPKAKKGSCIIL